MKISKHRIKRLITEIINEGSYIITDPDGVSTLASDAHKSLKRKDASAISKDPSLDSMIGHDDPDFRSQGRLIAQSLDLQDELTDAEEAVDTMSANTYDGWEDGPKSYLDQYQYANIVSSKNPKLLKHIGFNYVSDRWPDGPGQYDYDDWGDTYREDSEALGCEITDLAYLGSDPDYDLYENFRNALLIAKDKGDADYLGNSGWVWNDTKIFIRGFMGGYWTFVLCGK